jgi:hypothetical protein
MVTIITIIAIVVALGAGAVGLGTYINAKRAQSTNKEHAAWRRHHNTAQTRRPPSELK